jgi:hypothetical protein
MKLKTFGIASVVMVTACSSQPRQPAGPATAAAASTPAASLHTAAAKPVSTADPAPASGAAGQAAPINRTLLSAGYKPTTIKGVVYYCRMEDVTNTAFKRKVCLNESQLKDQERKIREMQDSMIRRETNPSCMGPTC